MDAGTLQSAREIFERVVDLPRAERDAQLQALCGDRPALLSYVRGLLAADDASFAQLDTMDGVVGVVAHAIADAAMPEQLGAYRVIGELGRGGMGIVYEGEQDLPRRRVALKTLHPLMGSDVAVEQFRNEVQAMAKMLHPSIPQVYETFEDHGRPVVAMELVRGVPLQEAAQARSQRTRLDWLIAIARAVDHAHRRGVIHRDLKPANVLISDEDERPKVLDFGLAALVEGTARRGGTLAYVAPEQLREDVVDVRSDVYGLGAMAFEVLVGHPSIPVGADLTVETALELKSREVDVPTSLGRPLAAVLTKMLQERPSDRYSSAKDVADELQRVLDHRPVHALKGSIGATVAAFSRRHAPAVARFTRVSVGLGLVWLGASWVWNMVEEAQRAEAAEQALDAVRALDPELQEAAFQTFVTDEAHVGTPAIADAWTWRSEVVAGEERFEALASSWIFTSDPDQEERALLALSHDLIERRRWTALRGVVRELMEEHADVQVAAALSAWDWPAALGMVKPSQRPLLAPFLEVSRDVVRRSDGELGIDGFRYEMNGDELWQIDREGEVSKRWDVSRGGGFRRDPRMVFSGRSLWYATAPDGILGHVDLDSSEAASVVTALDTHWVLDMEKTEDGFLLGVDANAGVVLQWNGTSMHVVDPELIPAGGAAQDVIETDLDGDGEDDLFVAIHGWAMRDVRVQTPDGWSRYRMFPRDMVTIRTPNGPRLAVVGQPPGALPVVPSDAPQRKRYLVVLALEGGQLVEDYVIPIGFRATRVQAADLDGDGFDEMVISRPQFSMALVNYGAPASEILRIPGLWPQGVGQLDHDPADELWVVDKGDGSYLIGAGGTERTDPIARAQLPAEVPAPLASNRDVVRRWDRTEALASLGLVPEAAAQHASLAAEYPVLGQQALGRALDLLTLHPPEGNESSREEHAFLLSTVARQLEALGRNATAEAVLLEDHRFDALPTDALPQRLDYVRVVGELAFHPAWQVFEPQSVQWDPLDGELFIDELPGDEGAFGIDFEPAGRELVDVRMTIDLIELDFASQLVVSLGQEDERLALRIGKGGGGPRENHANALFCGPLEFGKVWSRKRARLGERELRMSWRRTANGGVLRCQVDEMVGTFETSAWPFGEQPRLQWERMGSDDIGGRLYFRLDDVEVAGLRPLSVPPSDATRFVHDGSGPIQDLRFLPVGSVDLATVSDAVLLRWLRTQPEKWASPIRQAMPDRFSQFYLRIWQQRLRDVEVENRLELALPALANLPLDRHGIELARHRASSMAAWGAVGEARAEAERIIGTEHPDLGYLLLTRLAVADGRSEDAHALIQEWLSHSTSRERVLESLLTIEDLSAYAPVVAPQALEE